MSKKNEEIIEVNAEELETEEVKENFAEKALNWTKKNWKKVAIFAGATAGVVFLGKAFAESALADDADYIEVDSTDYSVSAAEETANSGTEA